MTQLYKKAQYRLLSTTHSELQRGLMPLTVTALLSPWHTCHKSTSENLAPISVSSVMQIWYRFRFRLVPVLASIRTNCSIPSETVACTWLKWWFVIGCWLLFTFHFLLFVSREWSYKLRIHRLTRFQRCLFSAPEIFFLMKRKSA